MFSLWDISEDILLTWPQRNCTWRNDGDGPMVCVEPPTPLKRWPTDIAKKKYQPPGITHGPNIHIGKNTSTQTKKRKEKKTQGENPARTPKNPRAQAPRVTTPHRHCKKKTYQPCANPEIYESPVRKFVDLSYDKILWKSWFIVCYHVISGVRQLSYDIFGDVIGPSHWGGAFELLWPLKFSCNCH